MTETIGQQLKNARLARQMVLEQVSNTIHVRLHYLQALENDDRAALPSDVQGRGFLRLYAGFLDLPIQPLLDQWEGKNIEKPVPSPAAEKPIPSFKKSPAPTPEAAAVPAPEVVVEPTHKEETPQSDPDPVDPPPPVFVPVRPPDAVADTGSTSQQILAEIGLKLKSQRELLGLKLEDVERFTHVRLHYLQALEAGRLDLLPSPVQGRGMLNNYAHFLELDSDALLLRFADALQSRRVERAPQNPKGSPTAPTHKRAVQATGLRRFLTPDLVIGSSVILLLIVFAIWSAAQISSIRKDEIQPTVMGISDLVLTASPAALVTETGTPEPTTAGDAAVGGLNAPQATGTIPVIGDDPLQVYVIAKQRAWMRVSEDDQVKFMGRVSPGNAYTFSGTEKIELVTGNAAALQVFYNQNDLGFLGGIGQVATLLFTKDGIITPTAQYSPTPTVTPMLTITPSPSATVPSPTVTIYVP